MTEKTIQDLILEKVTTIEEQVTNLRIDVAILKAKSAIYGSFGGALLIAAIEVMKRIL